MSKLSVIYAVLCAAVLTAGITVQAGRGGTTPSVTGLDDKTLRAMIEVPLR